jgi:hypothetical protein
MPAQAGLRKAMAISGGVCTANRYAAVLGAGIDGDVPAQRGQDRFTGVADVVVGERGIRLLPMLYQLLWTYHAVVVKRSFVEIW